MITNSRRLGENIRKYRKLRHMTMTELGKHIDNSPSSISRYESASRIPSMGTINDIAIALHITTKELLEGTDTYSDIDGVRDPAIGLVQMNVLKAIKETNDNLRRSIELQKENPTIEPYENKSVLELISSVLYLIGDTDERTL